MDDDGLPNARPIALSDSPRCQRSHNSVFSAAVNPRRSAIEQCKHSIAEAATFRRTIAAPFTPLSTKRRYMKTEQFPPDKEEIDLWLAHNAPLTSKQLEDARFALYYKRTRQPFVVSKKTESSFTFTGPDGPLRILNNRARRYLLRGLRILARRKGFVGARPNASG